MGAPLLDRDFIRTLEQLSLLCRQHLSGTIGATHRSRQRGAGREFADYRRYSAGDDPRFLDWNAYLRFGKLFLKIYQTEDHIPVRILMDSSASMDGASAANGNGTGAEAKFLYARRLAAAFAYLALLRLDTVAVVPFHEKLGRPLTASGGRDRFYPLLEYLAGLNSGGRTDLLSAVQQFLGSFNTRGEVIVISDFFGCGDGGDEERSQRAVEMLRASGHDFILVQLHTPEEQRPSDNGELELEEVETGERRTVFCSEEAADGYARAFREFSSGLERLAVRNGGRYARATTGIPYQDFILGSLRHDGVLG